VWPTSADQQYETITSVQTYNNQLPIVDVTYNDDTGEVENGFEVYPTNSRIAFPGYSDLGYSVSVDGGNNFSYQPVPKIRPPNYGQTGGWDALWGDPAMTASRGYQNFVYISSLAISHTSMVNAGGSIVGSVENCGVNPCTSFIDGACIARSNDGGIHFMPIQPADCFTNGGHFYDGGSMESDLFGGIYASFNDVFQSSEAVWFAPNPTASFSLLTQQPFAGHQMVSHPRLRYDPQTGRLYIMGAALPTHQLQDGQVGGTLLIDYWDGSHWHGAVSVNPGSDVLVNPTIQRGPVLGQSARIRRANQFSFDVGTPSVLANDDIRVIYTSEALTPNAAKLINAVCTRDLVCTNVGFNWTTIASAGQQFDPVVIAQPFFITVPAEWAVSYNSTEFAPNDNTGTTLAFMTNMLVVDSGGNHLAWSASVLTQAALCPELDGQWGDYDDLRVLSISNNVTTFIRTHTDSRPRCVSRDTFIASPMHVTAHMFQ